MFEAYKGVKEIKLRIGMELYESQVTQAFDAEIVGWEMQEESQFIPCSNT